MKEISMYLENMSVEALKLLANTLYYHGSEHRVGSPTRMIAANQLLAVITTMKKRGVKTNYGFHQMQRSLVFGAKEHTHG